MLLNFFSGIGGTIYSKIELIRTRPFNAVLLNLMTNRSNAQVTIACNKVESSVLQGRNVCCSIKVLQNPIVCCLHVCCCLALPNLKLKGFP